jgi:acyl-CoA dehydrogenase
MDPREIARKALLAWQNAIKQNIYQNDPDFQHCVKIYLPKNYELINKELTTFAERVTEELEPLVIENNLPQNLPRLDPYDAIGNRVESIVHHPTYEQAGNVIYSSRLLERMAKPGGLLEALTFMFLSSQTGEAGHNCPVACSAGIIRVLQKVEDFPQKDFYLKKLTAPSYTENFTGAQFLTEIQGGSDVGLNSTEAYQDEQGKWRISGEKWFCSNADAELILMTARYDEAISGTKGLGLFLVPAQLDTGERNHIFIRRLKDKIGTRSMATAEMNFDGAYAHLLGKPEEGFKLVMENVLHISRLFNTFCVLGMARRAFHVALAYAQHRVAFGHPIIEYPLVKENLARIKAENSALLASIFATVKLQDDFDMGKIQGEEAKLLLRLLANLNKHLSALWSVEHIHHALDVLAGNGAIESFSTIPRLLRDCIVCENWEGTHNTLRMQILKDIQRFRIEEIYLNHVESKLAQLPSCKQTEFIKQGVNRLKQDLKTLKSASLEIQSLQIKAIVNQKSVLFAALSLLGEALHPQSPPSKMHDLDYLFESLLC